MNNFVLACAMALATLGALDAHAQAYGELGYTSATVKEDFFGYTSRFDQKALRGIVGYELTPNLAAEVLATFGIGTNSLKEGGSTTAGVKMKQDYTVGIYIKPKTKLSDKVEVFGRVGLVLDRITRTDERFSSLSYSGSEVATSLGVGLSYSLTPATSLNVDYMQTTHLISTRTGSVTVGMGYKF